MASLPLTLWMIAQMWFPFLGTRSSSLFSSFVRIYTGAKDPSDNPHPSLNSPIHPTPSPLRNNESSLTRDPGGTSILQRTKKG